MVPVPPEFGQAMTQRGRCAALVLVVLTAVLPGWAEAPLMRPEQGLDIPWSTGLSGWMVWFEDETFEDCGIMLNGRHVAADQCSDIWQPALPRPVATEEACQILRVRYSMSSEEFMCSKERPAPQNDDWADPSSGKH